MVSNMKQAGRDECLRMDQLGKKVELCQVTRVWTHNIPDDKNWQSCDVIVQDAVPLQGAQVSSLGPLVRLRVPVVQRHTGSRSGTPWTPRVGDSVLVAFYQNDRPIIIGMLHPQFQEPVCRSTSNPGQLPEGAHEDWTEADYHNLYDWRMKLVQWLHIPRRQITDSEGRTWDTTFNHTGIDGANKLRPVCFNYFDKTRDVMAVFECKKGKATPDCKDCELNYGGSAVGPDYIKCENEPLSGSLPAMNTWLKILSSDYEGSDDIKRRLKLHFSCGSLFCSDSKCGSDNEGRLWLESQVAHAHRGHIEFKSDDKGADIAIRSDYTNAAYIRLYGKTSVDKGRVLVMNCDAKNYLDIKHDGSDYLYSPSLITLKAPEIILDGNVTITGNNAIEGSCSHNACSCPCGGGDGGGGGVPGTPAPGETTGSCTGTGESEAIEHGQVDCAGNPCAPSSCTATCAGGSCSVDGCDDVYVYITATLGETCNWLCTQATDGWGDWAPCF